MPLAHDAAGPDDSDTNFLAAILAAAISRGAGCAFSPRTPR
jgi:hypothetical protein